MTMKKIISSWGWSDTPIRMKSSEKLLLAPAILVAVSHLRNLSRENHWEKSKWKSKWDKAALHHRGANRFLGIMCKYQFNFCDCKCSLQSSTTVSLTRMETLFHRMSNESYCCNERSALWRTKRWGIFSPAQWLQQGRGSWPLQLHVEILKIHISPAKVLICSWEGEADSLYFEKLSRSFW